MAQSSVSGFCPRYHRAVELIGRRWTGAIVRLLLGGPKRYTELAEVIPEISDRMLAERLRELEAEEIVTRTVLSTTPVGVEYSLTDKGRDLQEAIAAISRWAECWVPSDAAGRASVRADASRRAAPAAGGTRSGRRRRAG